MFENGEDHPGLQMTNSKTLRQTSRWQTATKFPLSMFLMRCTYILVLIVLFIMTDFPVC